jgi:hypothetical protein
MAESAECRLAPGPLLCERDQQESALWLTQQHERDANGPGG